MSYIDLHSERLFAMRAGRSLRYHCRSLTPDFGQLDDDALLAFCLEGNREAWREFLRRFQKVIQHAISFILRERRRYSPDLVEDILQEVYVKLVRANYKILRDFKSTHPGALYGFMKVVAANAAIDYLRKLAPKGPEVELTTDIVLPTPQDIERNVVLEEIDCALKASKRISNRDRLIFWLYFRQGFTAKAIAGIAFFNLTQKGVEAAILRVVRVIREYFEGPGRGCGTGDEPEGKLGH